MCECQQYHCPKCCLTFDRKFRSSDSFVIDADDPFFSFLSGVVQRHKETEAEVTKVITIH